MDDFYTDDLLSLPGFRLHKLEVYNWGTFDSSAGNVFTVRPNGQTALLIGQNGSGKSTLVDALLTLLVKPVVRNYNVAAGAGKQERNERTYIKGAFDRRSREDDHRADIQYLRPEGHHYSALLACFRDADSDSAFTVAQVLYLNSEGRADKIYCFAPEERGIATDIAGLVSTERLRQQLEERGFRATVRYKDYYNWLRKATHVKPKAMDMFNQTVAVKDIQSLTKFIREHMLEAKPWGEKIDGLLNHFTQLSEAHQSLVRVRKQSELLEPIAKRGADYCKQADRLAKAQQVLAAADAFFREKTVMLMVPKRDAMRTESAQLSTQKEQLRQDIAAAEEEVRRLTNEIEQAGGERLRQIPLLIEKHQAQAEHRRDADRRYRAALRTADIRAKVIDDKSFAKVRKRLPAMTETADRQLASTAAERDERMFQLGSAARQLRDDQHELDALKGRKGNLPEYLAEMRRQLCSDLQLAEKDVPFAAELIAVKPAERKWEASLEMVLRGMALSLLVADRHYRLVSGYIERTRLADRQGRGRRLVYLRVGPRSYKAGRTPQQNSLLKKLDFRQGHSLLPWVQAELQERFDYRCCETIEEFQAASGRALTHERHVKTGDVRHEKDDRPQAADPRNFVLGWDNRQKQRHLAEAIENLRHERDRLESEVSALDERLSHLRDQQAALGELQSVLSFETIDYASQQREVEALQLERKQLEEQNDTVRLLKGRLANAQSQKKTLEASRDELIKREGRLESEIQQAEQLIAAAQKQLAAMHADGTFAHHEQHFGELEERFVKHPLTADDVVTREQQFLKSCHADVERLRLAVEPKQHELTIAMNRFLREFREEQIDLEASVEYLESFLGLLARIREDDLPRHEKRFKDRLNEKVIQEIGILNGALDTERSEIEDKIEQLNQSLRQLEYRPGTHMQLEARLVRDPEITDFRNLLGECLAGTFEGTPEADEARYLEIEKLVTRLREETRWREKVTDVRRWFDFAAREIERETGNERGYYQDSTGQSGGEKAKLAFTILVAAIAYQYDIDPAGATGPRFHFVVVDEMFSKVDDQYAEYALELFQKFGLQLLIVAPLDAKARVTEPYVGSYLHVVKDPATSRSEIFSMTAHEFEEAVVGVAEGETNGNGFFGAGLAVPRKPR